MFKYCLIFQNENTSHFTVKTSPNEINYGADAYDYH